MKKRRRKHRSRPLLFLLLIILLVFSIKPAEKLTVNILYPLRYEEHIEKYSNDYNLDKYLVMAIIKAESNFIPDAHSGVARGLMQITDDTALWISEKIDIGFDSSKLEDPKTNIKMGCYYLRYLLDYYDEDVTLSLAAYNAGMGNVDKWLKDPRYSKSGKTLDVIPFKETQKYIEKINKSINIYKKYY